MKLSFSFLKSFLLLRNKVYVFGGPYLLLFIFVLFFVCDFIIVLRLLIVNKFFDFFSVFTLFSIFISIFHNIMCILF